MGKTNVPLLAFNRGLISPKALARVDLDRTAMSAAVMTNWLPKTQGAMNIRPGTKFVGNSLDDTGAHYIEFVAGTDDVALVECTTNKMRIWVAGTGGDAHSLSLLERPAITTSLSLTDTGWVDASTGGDTGKASINSGTLTLNAKAKGSLAVARRRVIVTGGNVNTEHSLAVTVASGPVTCRVGTDTGFDNLVSETMLGVGRHNLAFTPSGNFHITLQTNKLINQTITTLAMGDTGTVVLTTPWGATNISDIRTDQSADVVFADCAGVRPQKIERRDALGRSWSVVDYAPSNGPFNAFSSSIAKLEVSDTFGNTTMNSDIPFFQSGHVGGLISIFHNGQSALTPLGALGAQTDAFEVTGFTDTGTAGANRERRIVFAVTGTYTGTITIQKSFDGPDTGFHDTDFSGSGSFTITEDDPDDNSAIWYRAKMTAYTSGVAIIKTTYKGGGKTGVARITGYTNNTTVSAEVLSTFSDTGPSDDWQEGNWSTLKGFPSAVALHGGRLGHAGQANIFLSVSDDFNNFDIETVGDAGPIIRTLGSGPVDNIFYLLSLARLAIGTTGAELALRSSSLDEVLTPTNNSARAFSTQGSANVRALPLNAKGIFVQRSGQRLFELGPASASVALDTYDSQELTLLVPDLLVSGIKSIAIQRQPDTRIHCVLGDGSVAILTYEPQEEVLAWSKWTSDSGIVERVAILPGTAEDAVYYHVRRDINSSTNRFLEKWAKETESQGDTGLSYLSDCSKSFSSGGAAVTTITGMTHLIGSSVVVWGSDTGQVDGKDFSPDENGVQKTYIVDGSGEIALDTGGFNTSTTHAVVGIPYTADWKSTKLAYAAETGTALSQMKRTDKIAFVMFQTHNAGLFFGSDTGNLDPLPRISDAGAEVDRDKIFSEFDQAAMPFPGLWDADSRIHLRGKSPRPVTVMAAVPTITTKEKL